jgi:hypothetical protein
MHFCEFVIVLLFIYLFILFYLFYLTFMLKMVIDPALSLVPTHIYDPMVRIERTEWVLTTIFC